MASMTLLMTCHSYISTKLLFYELALLLLNLLFTCSKLKICHANFRDDSSDDDGGAAAGWGFW